MVKSLVVLFTSEYTLVKLAKSRDMVKKPRLILTEVQKHGYNSFSSSQLNNCGGLAEWTKAVVLKTIVAKVTGGSNPSPSALV